MQCSVVTKHVDGYQILSPKKAESFSDHPQSLPQCTAEKCTALQGCAVQCYDVQCSAVLCSAGQ